MEVGDQVRVRPARSADGAAAEKQRVRRREHLERDEQLSRPSVRAFIAGMAVSLMRDGRELRAALESAARSAPQDASALRAAINPYIQVVAPGERCQHTGLLLTDIWRYFRHTWTN